MARHLLLHLAPLSIQYATSSIFFQSIVLVSLRPQGLCTHHERPEALHYAWQPQPHGLYIRNCSPFLFAAVTDTVTKSNLEQGFYFSFLH